MPRLSTIIGHEAAIARIQAAVRNGSLGHAYLFAGPAGVGKTTTARALAKALNCDQAGSLISGPGDACDTCASCRQVDAGSYPDVHIVRPALVAAEARGGERHVSTEILISQIREMNRMLSLSPSVGRRKVFIVTPAEAMNEQAQNALLKSLEEPPEFSTIILCTESSESLLATVRSRCQVVPFGLVPRQVIQLRLRELFGLSPEDAAMIAALSQGRVGLAVRYASEPRWRQARQELLDLLVTVLGGDALCALQSAGALRDTAAKVPMLVETLHSGTETIADRVAGRLQLQMLFDELAILVRDLLVLKQVPDQQDATALVVNLDRIESLAAIVRLRSESRLREGLEAVLTAQDLLRRNVNPQLLLEDVLLGLTWGEEKAATSTAARR